MDGWATCLDYGQTAATRAGGWVVGTGATFSSEFTAGTTDRASTTFVANTVPDGTLDAVLGDALCSPIPLTGNFAAGNWTFQFAVQSPTQGGAADGQIVFRLLKADPNGSNPTEITSGQQTASICTNVAAVDANSTLTISLPAFSITNQHLFIQLAWKRTGAGGMTTTNIRLRTGVSATVGTTFLTTDFTEVAPEPTLKVISTGYGGYGPGTSAQHNCGTQTVGNALLICVAVKRAAGQQAFIGSVTDNFGHTYVQVGSAYNNSELSFYGQAWLCERIVTAGAVTVTVTMYPGYDTGTYFDITNLNISGLAGPKLEKSSAISGSGTGTVATVTAIGTGTNRDYLFLGQLTTVDNPRPVTPNVLAGRPWVVARDSGTPPYAVSHVMYRTVTVGATPDVPAISWTLTTSTIWGAAEVLFYSLVPSPRTASLTQTLGACTISATAALVPIIKADLTHTLDAATVASTVTAPPIRQASVTQTTENASVVSAVTAPPIRFGTVSQTLANATVSATGVIVSVITANVSVTLAEATIASDGEPVPAASLTQILAAATVLSTAVVLPVRIASASVTLGAATAAITTGVSTSTTLVRTLAPATVTAGSTSATRIVLDRLLASVTVISATAIGSRANVTQQLAQASLTADAAKNILPETNETYMWLM